MSTENKFRQTLPNGIEVVTRYAVGRREFKTLDEAERYLEKQTSLDALHRVMPGIKEFNSDFANGKGYLQHTSESFSQYCAQLATLMEYYYGEELANAFRENPRSGRVSRYLEDDREFSTALNRVFNICLDTYREWGQAYFVVHPEEGEQFERSPDIF